MRCSEEWGERTRRHQETLRQELLADQTRPIVERKQQKPVLPNRLNNKGSVEKEKEDFQKTMENAAAVYRQMLPSLLNDLSKIRDPRQPGKVKHKITVLMAYGIATFVFLIDSRREANRVMNSITFENLKAIFPELETLPHADTLARLLEKMDVRQIQDCMITLLKDLIRRKKFQNYLVHHQLLIAIDGTQKFYRYYQWDPKESGLVRHVGKEGEEQHYVYVLESVIVLSNGITLPFYSEFLTAKDMPADSENNTGETLKQDCERTAFRRLAEKIKKNFRNTSITILADGLYACGPVLQICNRYHWGFLINLKPKALPSVWDEALSLMLLEKGNRLRAQWGNRMQDYLWANGIEYEYRDGNSYVPHILRLNVALCHETWTEEHPRSTGETEQCETWYSWLSSTPLNRDNVFERCTKMARFRWKIENGILTEKHQGYSYEHCFSYTWNAMEGYHYLMKIGHLLNVLAVNSELLHDQVEDLGIRGFIQKIWTICHTTFLDMERIQSAVASLKQWRLVPAA
jgi:hypothetical protein